MTGKPGMLQSMRFKRVGHDLVTEQQQQSYVKHLAISKNSMSGSYQPPLLKKCRGMKTVIKNWPANPSS